MFRACARGVTRESKLTWSEESLDAYMSSRRLAEGE
jgi:hypothetical protein